MKIQFENISSYSAPARLMIFVLALLAVWIPMAAPIYWLLKGDANLVTIITLALLYIEFLVLVQLWGKKVYNHPRLLHRYGLVWTKQNGLDLLKGLIIGFFFCFALYASMGLFGWVEFKVTEGLFRIIVEGFFSAIGIALAEELLFRGWLLDELQRDYSEKVSNILNALIFALLHFLKPIAEVIRTLVTFPALLLLGLTLVLSKRSHQNRLGICIGLHAGLVWGYYICHVGQLVNYTNRVSPWITGIDGNPIAGIMGLIFLSIIAFCIKFEIF